MGNRRRFNKTKDAEGGPEGGMFDDREIKIHIYRKRQTSDSRWEFLRIENKQIKTVPDDSYDENWHKTLYFCVEATKSKRKIRGKLGHVVQIHVRRLA